MAFLLKRATVSDSKLYPRTVYQTKVNNSPLPLPTPFHVKEFLQTSHVPLTRPATDQYDASQNVIQQATGCIVEEKSKFLLSQYWLKT